MDDVTEQEAPDEPLRIVVPYTPRRWQREIHGKLRRFNVLVVHRGAGKLLTLDTVIPTPSGYTTMGAIAVGDTVIARDGQPCRVTHVSGVQIEDAYEVEFSTGERFICHGEHEWLTQTIQERQNENNRLRPRNRKENPKNTNNPRDDFTGSIESPKTTLQIMETLEEPYVPLHGIRQRNHRVKVMPPVEFEAKDLPIHPYVLGYWLGDGTSRTSQLTIGRADQEAFLRRMDELQIVVTQSGPLTFRPGPQGRQHRGVCYQSLLRSMNLLQNKHMPLQYLRGSIEQRWQLLQGLMDSDGHVDKLGKCEFTTILPGLAEDFRELVCSLGIKANTTIVKECRLNGERKRNAYRIGFKAYCHQPVFSLPRKKTLLALPRKSSLQRNRTIIAVRRLGRQMAMQCIMVDSPTHTYCIGRSYIATHNTILALNELIRKALSGPPEAEYVYLLPLKNQAHRNVWLPLKRHVEPLPYVKCNNNTLEVFLPNEAKIMVLGADDPEKLRGLHLHGIVLDEFADMHPNTWRAVRPMLSNWAGWVIWIGTPKGHNEFWRKYLQSQEENRPQWFGELLPWWKTNALKTEEIELMRSEMLPEEFAQELEVSFEAALVGAYYGKALADLREQGRISDAKLYRDDLEVHTGWDLGIRDRMAVWFFQLVGNDIHFIDYEEHSNWGFPEWAEVIRLKERNYGYRYGTHIAPFDIANRELGSGISRLESAEQVGIRFEQCPKQDVMDGIELVRRHLPRCRFQSVMCADGIEALTMYRAKIDKAGQGLGPEHSVFSHAADSARYSITHIVQVLQMPAMVRMPFLHRR